MKRQRTDVAVIGGGITGLACAHRLLRRGREVMVLEAAGHVGGVMQTVQRDGFLLEQGPFNVLVRSPEFAALLEELSDRVQPVTADRAAGRNRYVLLDGALHRIPLSPVDALTSRLLSARGKLRLLGGLLCSGAGAPDATIDDVVRRRFGFEVADRIASAITVGIWGAESDELEAASAIPTLARLDRGRSPLLNIIRSHRRNPPRREGQRNPRTRSPRGMISFTGGLAALCRAIADDLGERVLLRTCVQSVQQHDRSLIIRAQRDGDHVEIEPRHVVLAVGAAPAAAMLAEGAPALAAELRQIRHVSLTVMNLAFERRAVGHPLNGYGFLVPRGPEGRGAAFGLLGVLWADSVFPHHAPPGHVLMRIFFGGTRRPDLAEAPDENVQDLAMHSLRPLLQITGDPVLVDIHRWPHAVPLYQPGHAARVERLRQLAQTMPGLHLAGAFRDGVSVNDCIARGIRTADDATGG